MSRLAGGFSHPAAALLRAAVFGCVLAVAACGEQTAPAAGADGGSGAGATGAAQTSQSGSGGQGAGGVPVVLGPSGPLDTTGWVAQPPFYGVGDEPFWRLEIIDGWFSFKRSALRAIDEPMVQPTKEAGADVFAAGSLKIVIRGEACTTGGQSSEVAAEVSYDDVTYVGCVFPAPASGVATSVEADAVVKGVASIDACLAKLAQPALVTGVAPRQDGAMMSVAMRVRNGTPYECGAETSSGNILYLDPIEVGAQAQWMNRMRFVREGVAMNAACDKAEEVRSGETVLGRMIPASCKF
jgi:hypothetical protein